MSVPIKILIGFSFFLVFVIYLIGLNLLIEPKAITRPSGNAPMRVNAKSSSVFKKPSFKAFKTSKNILF